MINYLLAITGGFFGTMYFSYYYQKLRDKHYYQLIKKMEKECKDAEQLHLILDLKEQYEDYFSKYY